MIAFTLFVFEEPRKDKMMSGFVEMGMDILLVLRYVFEPSIFIPFMFFWLVGCIPGMSSTTQYILIGEGDWTIADLGYLQISFGVIYVFLLGYVVNMVKNTPLEWIFIF